MKRQRLWGQAAQAHDLLQYQLLNPTGHYRPNTSQRSSLAARDTTSTTLSMTLRHSRPVWLKMENKMKDTLHDEPDIQNKSMT
eukprot:6492408-Amphidinium_carterae.1